MAIIASVMLLIAGGVFGFMIREVITEANELSVQVEILQETQTKKATFIQLERISDDTLDERAKLASYFLPTGSERVKFLDAMTALAPQVGINLDFQQIQERGAGTDDAWVDMTLAVSGSRNRVQNFVKILETLPYVTRVNNISVSSNGGNWQGSIDVQIRVMN